MSRVTTEFLDRVRTRLADTGEKPTPSIIADAVRAESGKVLGDEDVLFALRTLHTEMEGAGEPSEPVPPSTENETSAPNGAGEG